MQSKSLQKLSRFDPHPSARRSARVARNNSIPHPSTPGHHPPSTSNITSETNLNQTSIINKCVSVKETDSFVTDDNTQSTASGLNINTNTNTVRRSRIRSQKEIDKKPVRRWVRVLRPPKPGVGFCTEKWIPFESLVKGEKYVAHGDIHCPSAVTIYPGIHYNQQHDSIPKISDSINESLDPPAKKVRAG
mmetsp:Transcript_8012/g.11440  ORF Transcript_8012/g.11440 Transcript_8012/m.11440 type:complete len:190 (-) Transcript_8012:744-1313(-)